MSKIAICTTAEDAAKIQQADDEAAGLPRDGVFVDGSPAPKGWGTTLHLHAVTPHPKASLYAYPVADTATAKPGEPLSRSRRNIVDRFRQQGATCCLR